MEAVSNPTWPLSWREKMDLMDVGEGVPVDEKVVKSVRYIASKHFHSNKSGSVKQFTVKKDPENPQKWKLWRKNDRDLGDGGNNNDKLISDTR